MVQKASPFGSPNLIPSKSKILRSRADPVTDIVKCQKRIDFAQHQLFVIAFGFHECGENEIPPFQLQGVRVIFDHQDLQNIGYRNAMLGSYCRHQGGKTSRLWILDRPRKNSPIQ